MIFYISSQGHAATGWIASAFSAHPEVICYHATRTIPPVTVHESLNYFGTELSAVSGYDQNVADTLVHGLYQSSKHSGRVFGAIHTIWGLKCKAPVEACGGVFAGVVRHPIMQVHSIMNAFLPRAISHQRLPVDYRVGYNYLDVIEVGKKYFDLAIENSLVSFKGASIGAKKEKIFNHAVLKFDKWKVKSHIEEDFKSLEGMLERRGAKALARVTASQCSSSMSRVFGDHCAFVKKLDPDKILIMERITSDFEYFKEKFKILTGEKFPDDLKEKIFKLDHRNRHSIAKSGPEDVWQSWPESLREAFWERMEREPALRPYYKSCGYWLPE